MSIGSSPALKEAPYTRKVLLLILLLFCIRLGLAFFVELGNDESYYWLYSQKLQWNYFDHPPMVAVWIRFFTANLLLEDYPGFIRLGSIVSCALSTWFIYKAVSLIHSEKAGWYVACLYNASFYAGMIAGIFIWPDAPQMLFWTLSMFAIAKVCENGRSWSSWILFGISAGLCIMSKIHGVFLWTGLGLFILFHKRTWLKMPQLYVSVLLTALIVSPILFWNISHDFVTYKFHSERVVIQRSAIDGGYFFEEFLGQFLLNNPFIVILIGMALTAWRKKEITHSPAISIFQFMGIPLIVLLFIIAISRDTYPHWSGPAWVSLLPVAAVWLAEKEAKIFPSWIKLLLGGFILFIVCWPFVVRFYPGMFGSKDQKDLGKGDTRLDIYGWKKGGEEFAGIYRNAVKTRDVPPNTPLVSYKWWGAHVEYYFSRPAGTSMIGLGPIVDTHHYLWINNWRKDSLNFTNAFCIVPSDEWYDVHQKFDPYYSKIDSVTKIETVRMGKTVRFFYVYKLSGWKNELPIAR